MAGQIQYGQRTKLCNGLNNKSVEDQIKFLQTIAGSPLDSSTQILKTDINPYTDGARQWTYQCCTQFGWWQTAQNNSNSLRPQDLNVTFY